MSLSHLIVILIIILLLFGAGRVPAIMGDLAKGLKTFRNLMNEEDRTEESDRHDTALGDVKRDTKKITKKRKKIEQ